MNRRERRAHLAAPLAEREPTFDLSVGLLTVRWADERREVVRRWSLAPGPDGAAWTCAAPLLTLPVIPKVASGGAEGPPSSASGDGSGGGRTNRRLRAPRVG